MKATVPTDLFDKKIAIVLVTAKSSVLSGAEKRFLRIFIGLRRLGLKAYLICNRSLKKTALDNPEFSINIHLLAKKRYILECLDFSLLSGGWFSRLRIFPIIVSINRIVKHHQIDVCHVPLSLYLASCLSILQKNVVFEITSPDVANKFSKFRNAIFARKIKKFIAVSPSVEKASLETKYGARLFRNKLATAEVAFFVINSNETRQVLSKEKIVVFASRFIERKNPLLFARVAKKFLKEHQDWKVYFLGRGRLENEIKIEMEAEISQGKVFVGRVPTLQPILRKSTIFISLIERDNYPSQSVMEAMECENAIVLSDRGDSHRFIANHNGVVVNLDEDSVLQALRSLANNFEHTVSIGKRSRQCIVSDFPPERYYMFLLTLYGLVMSSSKKQETGT